MRLLSALRRRKWIARGLLYTLVFVWAFFGATSCLSTAIAAEGHKPPCHSQKEEGDRKPCRVVSIDDCVVCSQFAAVVDNGHSAGKLPERQKDMRYRHTDFAVTVPLHRFSHSYQVDGPRPEVKPLLQSVLKHRVLLI